MAIHLFKVKTSLNFVKFTHAAKSVNRNINLRRKPANKCAITFLGLHYLAFLTRLSPLQ